MKSIWKKLRSVFRLFKPIPIPPIPLAEKYMPCQAIASSKFRSKKMNPEAKKLWIDWLRDPNNKQGTGQLKKGDAYCCLGGLCVVYQEATGKGKWDLEFFVTNSGRSTSLPTWDVARWAGLENANPFLTIDGFSTNATMHNDDIHQPFSKIANAIEEQL